MKKSRLWYNTPSMQPLLLKHTLQLLGPRISPRKSVATFYLMGSWLISAAEVAAVRVPPTLENLPTEMKRAIFDRLGRVSSTCLGLTCKSLWAIHSLTHRPAGQGGLELYGHDPPPINVKNRDKVINYMPNQNPFAWCVPLADWMASGG